MSRPKKQTVDYFPHYCRHKKTMYILEQRYGNDGYAFWFKLLELLGDTEGHYLNLNDDTMWEFLQAKTRLDPNFCNEILNLLAKLDAIDPELWSQRVVWSQNFVDGIAEVYKNRRTEVPSKPDLNSFYTQKPGDADVSTVKNPREIDFSGVSTTEKPQSKVKESKVKESTSRGNHPPTPYEKIKDLYNNICVSCNKVQVMSERRKKNVQARWKQYQYNLSVFEELFRKVQNSSFLRGNNDRKWKPDFDWLMNETNMTKVLEGKYDDKKNKDPAWQEVDKEEHEKVEVDINQIVEDVFQSVEVENGPAVKK